MIGPRPQDDTPEAEAEPSTSEQTHELAAEAEAELTDLLADCDDLIAAGEEPSTDESVVGVTAEGLKPKLMKRLDCLRRLDKLRPGKEIDPHGFPFNVPDSSWRHGNPTRIGRFQVRRKLGHGGFGSVYLAYDPKLRRQVALKVPHPRTILTTELRERFQLEAETAAVLDHRNVVPIYESGEAGPLCYIASAYCPGISLAAWLREKREPVPGREAAALVAEIADGVQHAHERGVLHRDLKPGNILLTPLRGGKPVDDVPTPEAGLVLEAGISEFLPRITDFGMAKRVGEWEEDSAGDDESGPLTKTGAVMGTPTYMAPEQAAGRTKEIGRATDVHGLGIILYELLTGQTPFLAESTTDILRRVQNDEPLSPRKLRPKLPRDLETICLKCLEKEPRRRYQGAGELAVDLRNFVDGRTINARSVGQVERAWRWSLREPLVAGLLMSLLVVITSAFFGMFALWRRERVSALQAESGRVAAVNAKAAESAALLKESAARSEAEENFKQLRNMMEEFTTVAGDLSDEPAQLRIKRRMMERLLEFHKRFLDVKGNDPDVILEALHAYDTVGHLEDELVKTDAARTAFEREVDLADQLVSIGPTVPEYRYARCMAYYWRGQFRMRRLLKAVDALADYGVALKGMAELRSGFPDESRFELAHAVILANWARIYMRLQNPGQARRAFPEVVEVFERELRRNPGSPEARERLAHGLITRAWVESFDRRFDDEGESRRRALEIMEELVDEVPESRKYRQSLCSALDSLGAYLYRRQDYVGSERHYRRGLQIARELIRAHPDVADYQYAAADILADLGHDLPWARREEAVRDLKDSLELSLDLNRRFDFIEYRHLLGRVYYLLYNHTVPIDGEESLGYLIRHVEVMPEDYNLVNDLAWKLLVNPNPKLRDHARAMKLINGSLSQNFGAGNYLNDMNTLGLALYRQGDYLGAVRSFEYCIRKRRRPMLDDILLLAMAQKRLGRDVEAAANLDAAQRMRKLSQAKDPEWPAFFKEAEAVFAEKP